MNVGGMDCIAHEWLRSARIDLDLALAYSLQHTPRIEYGLIERGIAVDGADTKKFNAWIVGSEEESVCVLFNVSNGIWCLPSSYIVARVLGRVSEISDVERACHTRNPAREGSCRCE
jgi:hypothetical protein